MLYNKSMNDENNLSDEEELDEDQDEGQEQDNIINTVKKPKKKKKLLKFLVIFVTIILAIVMSLGFMFPGLLWAKDLGIRYTTADYESAIKKLAYVKDAVPTGKSQDKYTYVYGAVTGVDIKLTSEEITAFINTDRPSYYAVKNVQVRLNDDGTVDVSGKVDTDYVLNEFIGGKYSKEEIAKNMPALGILPKFVNVSMNLKASISNNSSDGNINSASVQGTPIPDKYTKSSEAQTVAIESINNFIKTRNSLTGSSVDELYNINKELILKGKFPTSLTRTKR